MPTARQVTDDEHMRLAKDGQKHQLVDGEILVTPAGARHAQITVRLTARLFAFVSPARLGEVFDSSTGFRMPNGNVRVPEASFVSTQRLPDAGVPNGFIEGPPDLAVEAVSPGDNPRHILDGVGEYLAAGVRLVWVIDPQRRRVRSRERRFRLALALGRRRLRRRQLVSYLISTGYGRFQVPFRNLQVTDLTGAARGAAFFFPRTRTVLDIAGQTMKASRLG